MQRLITDNIGWENDGKYFTYTIHKKREKANDPRRVDIKKINILMAFPH